MSKNLFKKLLYFWNLAFISLFPLFIFPWLSDAVNSAKNFFLYFWVLLGLVIWLIGLVKSKEPEIKVSFFLLPLSLFFLAALISWFKMPVGAKVVALVQPLGLGTILAFLIWFFLALQSKEKIFLKILSFSGLVLFLVQLILFLLPSSKFPLNWQNIIYINGPLWTNAGSFFGLIILFLSLAIFWIEKIFKLKRSNEENKILVIAMAFFFLVASGLASYQFFKLKPVRLEINSSWATAIETIKRKPLFGVGPANFIVAFNRYRPVEYSQTANAANRFGQSGYWFLEVLTETGILGFVFWALSLFYIFKVAFQRETRNIHWFVLVAIALAAIFPSSLLGFWLLLFFALIVGEKKVLKLGSATMAGTIFALVTLLVGLGGYFTTRALLAEMAFRKSFVLASENKGMDAYNAQLRTIGLNRFLPGYRVSHSQTNMAFFLNLAQKGDLTDQDKQALTQLAQQAIFEAKAAIALNPENAILWQNLAQVYRQLVGIVNEADQWAVAAYQQAVVLEPFNPQLRLDLGGLLYSLNAFEESAREFETSVRIKPDFANAWYNWAWSLRQQKKGREAVEKMQQVLNLVDVNSADFERANQELEDWKKEFGLKEAAEATETGELQRPTPIPSLVEPQIELSEEATPEIQPLPTEPLPSPEAEQSP